MKLLTRYTDYAIRAVCFIAKNDPDIVSVCSLAKELKMPLAFLRKILQALNKKGILISYKGAGGGFRLGLPDNKIFIIGLIEVFQGPLALCEHTFKNWPCHDTKKCILKRKLDAIECYIRNELKNITIAMLIGKE